MYYTLYGPHPTTHGILIVASVGARQLVKHNHCSLICYNMIETCESIKMYKIELFIHLTNKYVSNRVYQYSYDSKTGKTPAPLCKIVSYHFFIFLSCDFKTCIDCSYQWSKQYVWRNKPEIDWISIITIKWMQYNKYIVLYTWYHLKLYVI